MYTLADKRLTRLINSGNRDLLRGGLIGLEKESLRVSAAGSIAQTPHPRVLGAALTNPYVTTDYSEALAEFITPPFASLSESLAFLRDTQKFVYDNLEDEILWATSMPCILEGVASIPIARYGSSNAGMMKTVYRRGLGHRYGRVMQVIAGVHFNYSLPEEFWRAFQELEADDSPAQEFISKSYFGLIRNLLRFGWLVPYLFGASPALCKSYIAGEPADLEVFDESTYYLPYATSLRMGDIGYQNRKEQGTGVNICYNDLDSYMETLSWAIETPCPIYAKIGVVVNGRYEQLNANILQIENEYYSTVRPKQIPLRDEKPILSLRRRGVRYVELRSLDVNAYDPLGINDDQLRFLEALMIFCLLVESPPIDAEERREIDENEIRSAHRGREPSLALWCKGREIRLRDWAMEIFDALPGICAALDSGRAGGAYITTLSRLRERVHDPDRTPSARMLAEMYERSESFHYFAKRMSLKHNRYFRELDLNPERRRHFAEASEASLRRQQEIETADDISFAEYLARYFAQ